MNYWTRLCENSMQTVAKKGRNNAISELLNWKANILHAFQSLETARKPVNYGLFAFFGIIGLKKRFFQKLLINEKTAPFTYIEDDNNLSISNSKL
jgi:hypothetical protein